MVGSSKWGTGVNNKCRKCLLWTPGEGMADHGRIAPAVKTEVSHTGHCSGCLYIVSLIEQ